jgi:hypothetical protein
VLLIRVKCVLLVRRERGVKCALQVRERRVSVCETTVQVSNS